MFNLQTDLGHGFVYRQFPAASPELARLFFTRLLLFVKYEDQALVLKPEVFEFMRCALEGYLDYLAAKDLADDETVRRYSLVLRLSSHVFLELEEGADAVRLGCSLMKQSLLHRLGSCATLSSREFWKAYLGLKSARPRSGSNVFKAKASKTLETMVYFNYLLSLDISAAIALVEDCAAPSASSLHLSKGLVKLRIGEAVFELTKGKRRRTDDRVRRFWVVEKLPFVLELVSRGRYLAGGDSRKLLCLDRFSSDYLAKRAVQQTLLCGRFGNDRRKALWVSYLKHHCDLPALRTQLAVERCAVSEAMAHQIEIDVVRTKKWRGDQYQRRLQRLVLSFFASAGERLEYFQGFNYIMAFLSEVLDSDEDCLAVARHLSTSLLAVGSVGLLRPRPLREDQPAQPAPQRPAPGVLPRAVRALEEPRHQRRGPLQLLPHLRLHLLPLRGQPVPVRLLGRHPAGALRSRSGPAWPRPSCSSSACSRRACSRPTSTRRSGSSRT